MGLFSFLGGSKVDRLVKKVTNQWGQPQERQRAMQMLADIGSEEALFGLMRRFDYRVEASITDEEEKQLAYDLIVAASHRAAPAIEKYVSERDTVYWPLKALKEIAGTDQAVELLLRALDRAGQRDERVNEQRTQLVANLRDFPHPRVQERLRDLCTDENEEVRMMALDGYATYGEKVAVETLVMRILDPDESPSVKTVIFEQLIEAGWSLAPWQAQIVEADVLPSFYRLGKKGKLERA